MYAMVWSPPASSDFYFFSATIVGKQKKRENNAPAITQQYSCVINVVKGEWKTKHSCRQAHTFIFRSGRRTEIEQNLQRIHKLRHGIPKPVL